MNDKLLFHNKIQTACLIIICIFVIVSSVIGVRQIIRIADSIENVTEKVQEIDIDNLNNTLEKTDALTEALDKIFHIFK